MTTPYLFLTALTTLFYYGGEYLRVTDYSFDLLNPAFTDVYREDDRFGNDTGNTTEIVINQDLLNGEWNIEDIYYNLDFFSIKNAGGDYVSLIHLNISHDFVKGEGVMSPYRVLTDCEVVVTDIPHSLISSFTYPIEDYTSFKNIKFSLSFYSYFGDMFVYTGDLGTADSYVYSQQNAPGDMLSTYLENNEFYDLKIDTIVFTLFIGNADYDTFWQDGYIYGYQDQNAGWNLSNFLFSIVDLPVLYLRSLFGFDLFGGISMFAIISSLITISLVIFVIRKFI